MSGLWGSTKSYSSKLKDITTAGGVVGGGTAATGVVGTTTVTTTAGGIAGTTFTATTVGAAAAGVALAAAGGTLIGQGANWLISCAWDPVCPIYPMRDVKDTSPIQDAQVDLFLHNMKSTVGVQFNEIPPGTPYEFAGFHKASNEFVRVGTHLFVELARGAEAATRGDTKSLLSRFPIIQSKLKEYISTIEEVSEEAKDPLISRIVGEVQKDNYLQFINDCDELGRAALPSVEGLVIQQMLNLAGVRMDFDDFRSNIAEWVAEGPEPMEIEAFEASKNEALSYSRLLSGSIDWYWSRIDLSESPLLGEVGLKD